MLWGKDKTQTKGLGSHYCLLIPEHLRALWLQSTSTRPLSFQSYCISRCGKRTNDKCDKVLTEVSSEEATQMTSTSRSITTPRAIRLRWAAELP